MSVLRSPLTQKIVKKSLPMFQYEESKLAYNYSTDFVQIYLKPDFQIWIDRQVFWKIFQINPMFYKNLNFTKSYKVNFEKRATSPF